MAIQEIRSSPRIEVPPIDLRGVRVLLVDDDPDDLALVSQVLARAGATVVVAESVEPAVAHFRASRFDVLISDIEMPGCNGYQLMRMLRSRTPAEGGWTPAIALTGHTRTEDHTRALLAGFQLHLGKPLRPVDLLLAIRGLVERGR